MSHDRHNPHDYANARRTAGQLRQHEYDEFWRGADAAWSRISGDARQRLARSTARLQSTLARRAGA